MLSECLSTETAFIKNNIFEARNCDEGAVCCCSANVYVSAGGVNFCCSSGTQGCDAPTYDTAFNITQGYGCYSATSGTVAMSRVYRGNESSVSPTHHQLAVIKRSHILMCVNSESLALSFGLHTIM